MKLVLISIFDRKARSFGNVQCFVNEPVALRQISESVKRPESILNAHPEDFEVHRLGTMDTETGVVEGDSAHICDASSLVK